MSSLDITAVRRPRQVVSGGIVAALHALLVVGLLNLNGFQPPAVLEQVLAVRLVPPAAPRSQDAPAPRPDLAESTPVPIQSLPTPVEVELATVEPLRESTAPESEATFVPAHASAPADPLPPTVESVAYVREPPVRYPPLSKRLREQGLVVLRVLIDVDGRAADVRVHRSSGFARLDDAACDAVRRAEFKPYFVQGRPVQATALVPIEFSLAG